MLCRYRKSSMTDLEVQYINPVIGMFTVVVFAYFQCTFVESLVRMCWGYYRWNHQFIWCLCACVSQPLVPQWQGRRSLILYFLLVKIRYTTLTVEATSLWMHRCVHCANVTSHTTLIFKYGLVCRLLLRTVASQWFDSFSHVVLHPSSVICWALLFDKFCWGWNRVKINCSCNWLPPTVTVHNGHHHTIFFLP